MMLNQIKNQSNHFYEGSTPSSKDDGGDKLLEVKLDCDPFGFRITLVEHLKCHLTKFTLNR